MGLFQRRLSTEHVQMYTLGNQKSKLVVGLGNTGKEYAGTRHNAGFMAVDYFTQANDFPTWTHKRDFKSDISIQTIGGVRIIAVKPTTFMNLSGEAVQAIQQFYKISGYDTIVMYDELALPFGQIRTRSGGSDAGHNGIKSLIAHCGEDFGRIRIGIANVFSAKADASEFVLGAFTKDEKQKLPDMEKEVNALLNEAILAEEFPVETRSYL